MAHATNDLNAIQNVAGAGILTFADSVITGGTTIIAMILFIDWRLTLIALDSSAFASRYFTSAGVKTPRCFS